MEKQTIIKVSIGAAVLAAIGGAVWYFLRKPKEDNKLKANPGAIKGGVQNNSFASPPPTGQGDTGTDSTGTSYSDTSSSGNTTTPPVDDGKVDVFLFDRNGGVKASVRVSPEDQKLLMNFLPHGQLDAWKRLPKEMAVAYAMAFWWEYYWREKRTDVDHSPAASKFIRSTGIADWGKSAGQNANITGAFFEKYGRPNNNSTPIPVTVIIPAPGLNGYVYQTYIVPSSQLKGYR